MKRKICASPDSKFSFPSSNNRVFITFFLKCDVRVYTLISIFITGGLFLSISDLRGKQIDVVMSGKIFFQGKLIENGKDILVLFDGQKYVYIPLIHVHRINRSSVINDDLDDPSETSLAKDVDSISYRPS